MTNSEDKTVDRSNAEEADGDTEIRRVTEEKKDIAQGTLHAPVNDAKNAANDILDNSILQNEKNQQENDQNIFLTAAEHLDYKKKKLMEFV